MDGMGIASMHLIKHWIETMNQTLSIGMQLMMCSFGDGGWPKFRCQHNLDVKIIWVVIPLIFPKVPQSSQTESLGFSSYILPLDTPPLTLKKKPIANGV